MRIILFACLIAVLALALYCVYVLIRDASLRKRRRKRGDRRRKNLGFQWAWGWIMRNRPLMLSDNTDFSDQRLEPAGIMDHFADQRRADADEETEAAALLPLPGFDPWGYRDWHWYAESTPASQHHLEPGAV